jgi:nitrogen fixation protein NifQ
VPSSPAFAVGPKISVYRELMARAVGDGNDHVLACMIASWQAGGGSMPDWLGLSPAAFGCLVEYHFACRAKKDFVPLRRQLLADRLEEVDELEGLMLDDRAGESASEVLMAHIVAVGCAAPDHLWHDLGLWSRDDLTALMRRNFPALAARNVTDMKWKRFLYKQLCEVEGIYSCRAPSCELCTDYHVCFGSEH